MLQICAVYQNQSPQERKKQSSNANNFDLLRTNPEGIRLRFCIENMECNVFCIVCNKRDLAVVSKQIYF